MSFNTNITAYILCGGLSTRMQEEKGLVVYKEKSFVKHVIDAVSPITNTIHLVTKNILYKCYGYDLIPDAYEDKGPVGGIYTALKHSKTKFNLILSCDIPNINTLVLKKYLITNRPKKEITYLVDDDQDYPLIGLYSTTIVSKFNDAIINNELKLLTLIKRLEYNTIKIDSKDKDAFRNINTKEELQSLIRLKS